MSYFPSNYPKGRGPPREYFFNIVNSKLPDYLQQLLARANKQRMTADGEDKQTEAIKISQYWEEQLKAMPYISSKCCISSFINLGELDQGLGQLLEAKRILYY